MTPFLDGISNGICPLVDWTNSFFFYFVDNFGLSVESFLTQKRQAIINTYFMSISLQRIREIIKHHVKFRMIADIFIDRSMLKKVCKDT